MTHAGEAVAHELLGDEGEPVAITAHRFLARIAHVLAHGREDIAGAVGDTAGEFAIGVPVERAAGGIGRVLRDARHLQRLAVVEGGVAAAMLHHDR